MIKNAKEKSIGKIEIDLRGSKGNAFYLLGLARKLAKELNLDANKVTSKMMSKDYDNLVLTFDKYFGDYVILYR